MFVKLCNNQQPKEKVAQYIQLYNFVLGWLIASLLEYFTQKHTIENVYISRTPLYMVW
jgi:hypothetical protein